jgi:hypothetical protein
LPQPPQFAGSFLVSTQLSPQTSVPAPQTIEHCPERQNCPAGQGLSHAPQWAGSFVVLTQASPHNVTPVPHTGAPPPEPPAPLLDAEPVPEAVPELPRSVLVLLPQPAHATAIESATSAAPTPNKCRSRARFSVDFISCLSCAGAAEAPRPPGASRPDRSSNESDRIAAQF